MQQFRRGARLLALLLSTAFCAALFSAARRAPLFDMGYGYELYCGTSSAEIVRTDNPAFVKLVRRDVKGESVRYRGDRYEELCRKFHARLLFTERAAGVTEYFLYASGLGPCVLLGGQAVNLHIAVGNGQTAVGSPLIFGGF